MSSADSPSEASVGAAIWTPRASRRRTRIPPSAPSRRATNASAAGARRARGVLLANPGGRVPVPKVTISRCSIPRPPRGVAGRFEHVERRRRSADHVCRGGGALEVRPGQLIHRLGEPEIRKRVKRRDDVGDHRLQRVFLGRAEARLAGAGRRGNRRDDRSRRPGFHLRELPSVGDEPLRAGLRRVVDRIHLERILPAKLEHHPVDLDPVDARRVVDAALQQVSEQRTELLAVAHALRDGERSAQGGRGQACRERGERTARCAAVRAPRGAQHSRGTRLSRRRGHDEAAARRIGHRSFRNGSGRRHGSELPALDAANGSPRADLVPALHRLHPGEPCRGERRHPGVVTVRRAVDDLPGEDRAAVGRNASNRAERIAERRERVAVEVASVVRYELHRVTDDVGEAVFDREGGASDILAGPGRLRCRCDDRGLRRKTGEHSRRVSGRGRQVRDRQGRSRPRHLNDELPGVEPGELVRRVRGNPERRVAQQEAEHAGRVPGGGREDVELRVVVRRHRQPQVGGASGVELREH